MDRADLLKLISLRHLSLPELREREPELAGELDATLGETVRSRVTEAVSAERPEAAERVARADLTGLAVTEVATRLRSLVTGLAGEGAVPADRLVEVVTERARAEEDVPIGARGELADVLARGHLTQITELAGVRVDLAGAVGDANVAVTDDTLAALVDRQALTEKQAVAVGAAAAVYELADRNAELAETIRAAAGGDLSDGTWTRTLAARTAEDWAHLLRERGVAEQVPVEVVGAALAERFAALEPGTALLSRLPAAGARELSEHARVVDRIAAAGADPFDPDADLSGVPARERKGLAEARGAVRELVASYPGLRLAEVLGDDAIPVEERAQIAERRVSLLHTVRDRLDGDVLTLDLSPDSADLDRLRLDELQATPDEQRLLVGALKSYQRVYAVGGSVGDAQTLLRAGYASGVAIGKQPLEHFAVEGVAAERSDELWRTGRAALADSSLVVGALIDNVVGAFDDIRVGNAQPTAGDYLRKLDGYESLFGSLSFCSCQHCQSVLSPAAYFVDLMEFVREHVDPQIGSRVNHPLRLKTRRPDLWTLELTCENTERRLPKLSLVAVILENAIATQRGFAGDFGSRPAVEDLVYRRTLLKDTQSFAQPFHLPLARAHRYLEEHQATLAEVAAVLGADDEAAAAAELALSPQDWALVTQRETHLADLRRLYDLELAASGGTVTPFDVQQLVRATGDDRGTLGEVLATRFVAAGGATVTTKVQKSSSDSVQNDVERVHGLTADALDRVHRFTRLRRRLPWSVPELDRVLTALGETALDASGVARVVAVRAVQRDLGTGVDEAAAIAGTIPATGDRPLFDRLFNPAGTAGADRLPQPAGRFVHPAFSTATPVAGESLLPRLLAGLGIEIEDLETLIRALAPHLASTGGALDPDAADEAARHILLSADNLTLLYRHALVARRMRVDVSALFRLAGIAGLAGGRVTGTADVRALRAAQRWQSSSGYSLDDIAVATGGTPADASRYPDPPSVAARVVAGAVGSLTFGGTVFAAALGTTEQASEQLLVANPALAERTPDGRWRLVAGADLSGAVVVPAGATVPTPPAGSRAVTPDEVRGILALYEPAAVVARALAAELGTDVAKVEALARLAGVSLRTEQVALAVRGDGPVAPLTAVVAALRPLVTAFHAAQWDATAIDFVRANAARFAFAVPVVTVATLRALSAYVAFAPAPSATAEPGAVTAGDVRDVLAAFDGAAREFPAAVTATLARVLGVGNGLVASLRGRVPLPAVGAPALVALAAAARLAARLGIDGESLAALTGSDYAAIDRAATALRTSFGARFASDSERVEQLERLDERVREQRRDALVAWLLHSLPGDRFGDANDLYEHYLMEVEAGGCATTSPVIDAISTVQLYVHRVIMGLEQTAGDDPLALTLPSSAAAEWAWRKNYRVWEANRKVFLWPENYIEPDLRDDKTQLFRELEDELLQSAISDEDVLDAYTKYLKGFEEVATLTIAGVYHDRNESGGGDLLHLFGVTSTDPAVYYYRTCENLISEKHAVWTPWRKVDVQITGRRVAPVVYRGRLHLFWADYRTRPHNTISGGASTFAGYRHTMAIRYTTLRPDGAWTPPQSLALPKAWPFSASLGEGTIVDELNGDTRIPRLGVVAHDEPNDDYTLRGTNWDALYLDPRDEEFDPLLCISGRNYQLYASVNLFRRSIEWPHILRDLPGEELGHPVLCARVDGSPPTRRLYYGFPKYWYPNRNAYGDLVLDERRIELFNHEYLTDPLRDGLYLTRLAAIDTADLTSVAGSIEDVVIQSGPDVLLLQGSATATDTFVLRRIGTTLVEQVAYRLFTSGVDGLLDIQTQLALREAGVPFALDGRVRDETNAGRLDFTGPYGVYYRELFFHIPFLIANALNGRGNFAAAQRWYHYIFDPTANEVIGTRPGISPAERARMLLDRVWRYREFRNLDQARLREILTDEQSLAVYRRDPFNPHAIARLRLSAYQKSIVMKYVDNLLDWADFLFTQFTMESVNEAQMLYVMASDILGRRPAELGDCGEGGVDPRTYEQIAKTIGAGEEILTEVETWLWSRRPAALAAGSAREGRGRYAIDRSALRRARAASARAVSGTAAGGVLHDAVRAGDLGAVLQPEVLERAGRSGRRAVDSPVTIEGAGETEALMALRERVAKERQPVEDGALPIFHETPGERTQGGSWAPAKAAKTAAGRRDGGTLLTVDHRDRHRFEEWAGAFGWSIIRQVSPVFCVPVNRDLLAYWDRVDDRLYKIRHCMDITGARRELALLAPEIDPRLLVRMRAAGLTLEDVLGSVSGNLPPYRFLFLIDRAKAFAATLSSFGAALLAAIEKKDGEELNRLRLTHQQNLARITSQVRRREIELAEESLAVVERQREAAEYRRQYFDGLATEYRSGLENAESTMRHVTSAIYVGEAVLDGLAALFAALPQVGSPFAMKYGGVELNTTVRRFANAAHATANGLQAAATSVGLEASYERRADGWKHQRELAEHDLKQLDRQIEAARIRLDIANRALVLHEESIAQLDEMLELTDGKFSNLGLYTWLSSQLRRLYRSAYQNALALARLAEQAFQFERGDDAAGGLAPTYWDASHAGLLSGEQLLVDLQSLERRYLETNYRSLEVDQAFALSQVAPGALVRLREEGECRFAIPEVFFDLFYPGQYKRKIKGVRLTIPSITGPYVNVSATLTLDRSWIRTSTTAGAALTEVPPRRSVSVATSTAQNDAGVFELSFRDERYMPFEGAGAISEWVLTLPKTFRQFDYQTINDVILSISYTAEQDGALRARVETDNDAIEGALRKTLSDVPLVKVFSLRQDFSSAFTRLLHSPTGTEVDVEITDRHFPMFLGAREIEVTRATALLRTAPGAAPGAFRLMVDGAAVESFAPDAPLGGLPARPLPAATAAALRDTHTFSVGNAGGLAPPAPLPGDTSAVDAAKLLDVLLYVEYLLA